MTHRDPDPERNQQRARVMFGVLALALADAGQAALRPSSSPRRIVSPNLRTGQMRILADIFTRKKTAAM